MFVVLLLVAAFRISDGLVCKREIFGITTTFSCPSLTDDSSAVFCCGSENNRFCCSNPLGITEDDVEQVIEALPTIIISVVAAIGVLLLLCIVCCCCCPFCLLYKRRNRGNVLHTTTVTTAAPPQHTAMQPMLPPQAMPQPAPYPTQGYMPQPAPGYAPYPPQPMHAGTVEPAPPYMEKQSAYNPSY